MLQSPADCLKLSNAYNTELPYSAVSAALVVTVESLWLAHSMDGQYTVTVYGVNRQFIQLRYAYVCKYGYSN